MLTLEFKGVPIHIIKFSDATIKQAALKWAEDYEKARNDPVDDAFRGLENRLDWLAGQAPSNAESFIKGYLKREYPGIYWSLYPILPDAETYPDNPEWPLMRYFLSENARKAYDD